MSGLWKDQQGLSGGQGLSVGASGLWNGASGLEDGNGSPAPPPGDRAMKFNDTANSMYIALLRNF